MLIYLIAFVGGVLTILSPCILPVLPFVFAHADRPFRRAGLPLLLGMALTFSIVATTAAYGGHWVVRLNQGGRYVAMFVFLILGLSLLLPELAETLTRPLVRAGSRLQGGPTTETSVGNSFFLGISTGLLWAPCAGPILGLILTGAAIQGPGARSPTSKAGPRNIRTQAWWSSASTRPNSPSKKSAPTSSKPCAT
jgi:cytochrome c biogenesis protein CcdA